VRGWEGTDAIERHRLLKRMTLAAAWGDRRRADRTLVEATRFLKRRGLPFFASFPADFVRRRAEKRRTARIRAHLEHERAKWWRVSVPSQRGYN